LREFHRTWIRLRHEQRALSGPGFEVVHAGEQDEVLAFLRSDGEARALVVLNFSERPVQLQLALSKQHWPSRLAREITRAGKPRTQLRAQTLRLQLRGWDARVYAPE
jgi:hypothetical protein